MPIVPACWSSSSLWGTYPAVVELDVSRMVDWTWRTDCMVSSVAGSKSDGFFCRDARRSPSQDYRRSRGKKTSGCDSGICQYVKACSCESCASAFKLKDAASNTRPRFDGLIHWAI
jgi:hypothetical protein